MALSIWEDQRRLGYRFLQKMQVYKVGNQVDKFELVRVLRTIKSEGQIKSAVIASWLLEPVKVARLAGNH